VTAPATVVKGWPVPARSDAVRSAVARDADAALTALYSEHYRSLVRLAALLLDDVGLCEEVVQDAYIRVHRAWGRLQDRDKALAYLRQTVVNLARSTLRRRLVALKHAPKPMPDAASAE
jgi:DNA-directed RNA polymerase specialized sigma24 family protein